MLQKIAILAENIDVNTSSSAKTHYALIENLKSIGCDIAVWHFSTKNVFVEGIEVVRIKENRFSFYFFLSRSQRYFTKFTGIHLHKFFESIFGFSFTFFNDVSSIRSVFSDIQKFNPDYLYALSQGSSFRPHYALLSDKLLLSKTISYIHDPYPFHFYPRPFNFVQQGYMHKEKFFNDLSEKSAFFAFPSQLLMEWVSSYFPAMGNRGFIIPHQRNKSIPRKVEVNLYLDVRKFNLSHIGNLLKERSIKGLIKGFQLFLFRNPEAVDNCNLIFLGPSEHHIKELSKAAEVIPQLKYFPCAVPFDVAYWVQKETSVNIILESKSEISPFLPGKFPHCVEVNRPILLLSPYYSESRRLLGNEYPYYAEVDQIELIADRIFSMYNEWKANKNQFNLNRPDLMRYTGTEFLKKQILNIGKINESTDNNN
jgi:hypothetical protein